MSKLTDILEAIPLCEAYMDGVDDGCNTCPYIGRCKDLVPDTIKMLEDLAKRVPRWISVEERYPEHRKLVLFGYAKQKFVSIGYFDEECAEWCDTEDNEVVRPTHWMPLPATTDNEKEGQLNGRDG